MVTTSIAWRYVPQMSTFNFFQNLLFLFRTFLYERYIPCMWHAQPEQIEYIV